MTNIDTILEGQGFSKPQHVQGREAIANLFPLDKRCGIYVLHFIDGMYYVGQSVNVTRRYVEHRRNHPDIVKISFKLITNHKPELDLVERTTKYLLQSLGFGLRGVEDIDPLPNKSDFDLIMDLPQQEQWLNNPTEIDLSGSRIIDPALRGTYHGRFLRLKKALYFDEFIDVYQQYIRIGIPRARASEVSFWSCSCLPASNVYARVNINWQEVLSAFTFQDNLVYSFHMALSPLEFGMSLAQFYKRFPNLEVDINVNEQGLLFLEAEGLEEDLSRYFSEEQREMPDELVDSLDDFFTAYSGLLTVSNHRYRPGTDDQVRLIIQGKDTVLQLLQNEKVIKSIRQLNLRLMRKGPSPYRTSHCLDLADRLLVEELRPVIPF